MGQEHELYIYEYSDLDDDFIFMETKYTLEDLHQLQQENSQLKERIEKAIKITNKILMNNADNRMICNEEEQEYFDWLDSEMLKQEKILKGDKE